MYFYLDSYVLCCFDRQQPCGRVHTVWKVREKGNTIHVGQGESGNYFIKSRGSRKVRRNIREYPVMNFDYPGYIKC